MNDVLNWLLNVLNAVQKTVAKVWTVVADRRAQLVALYAALLYFGPDLGLSPEEVELLAESGDNFLGYLLLLLEGADGMFGLLVLFLGLLASWTQRKPSGLNY